MICDEGEELDSEKVLRDITTLIQSTLSRSSNANALRLNQEMQQRLMQARNQILTLLQLVRKRYEHNEVILVARQQPRKQKETPNQSGAIFRGATFRFKGYLYFRDVNGRSCPNNDDYERRCATEMFPTDFDLRSKHVWTLLDKKNLINGIKQQLLDHCTSNNAIRSQTMNKIDLHKQTIAKLLQSADRSFTIDWNEVSVLDVACRHSPTSCEAMWQVYLHPYLKRDEWTTQEDENLLRLAKQYNLQDWQSIAEEVGQRSDYQCFVRFQTALRSHFNATINGKWNGKDDNRLKHIVMKYTINGLTNWTGVMTHFPNRNKSTLIGRYKYVLAPELSHARFTVEEDMKLCAAVEEFKGKFHCIPRNMFPNRSVCQLRLRYNNVISKRGKTEPWSVDDDIKLMGFVNAYGISHWLNCANFLKNHTRTSCRTRYLVIKSFLDKNPGARVEDIPRRRKLSDLSVTADNYVELLEEYKMDPQSTAKRFKKDDEYVNKMNKILRSTDLNYYEYFKFSYDLQSHRDDRAPAPIPINCSPFCTVMESLNYRLPTVEPKKITCTAFSTDHRDRISKLIKQCKPRCQNVDGEHYNLPPSWSTLMGFRALSILASSCHLSTGEIQSSYDETSPVIQLFRQRLRALLFRTIILSRLDSRMFTELSPVLRAMPRIQVPNQLISEESKDDDISNQAIDEDVLHSWKIVMQGEIASKQLEELNNTIDLSDSDEFQMKEENLSADEFMIEN